MISTAPAGSFPTGTHRVVHTAVWLALLSLFLSSRLAVADEPVALKRWAILASPELQQSGAAELALVAISQAEGMELVERDQLQLAAKELKIEALAGAGGAGGRIQLGRLLKADALMLLSVQQYEGGHFLKAVVCDCASGARLRLEYLPYAPEEPEQAAERCRGVVEAVRGHFAGGVKQVIGVSSSVSKNLVHDYDHLQAGYARLLESALAAHPGVAVMETEEAQAIGRELLVSGPGEIRRFVPLLVEVDFLVQPAAGDEEPQITFTIRTLSAGTDRKPAEQTQTMPLGRAPEFVTEKLPLRLLAVGHSDSRPGISRPQQIRWLIERADTFSQLGAWEHATGLREAALLLDPNQARQRLKLFFEYRRIFYHRGLDLRLTLEYRRQKDPAVIDDRDRLRPFRARAAAYLAAPSHLEYLVRHRQIDRALALELGKKVTTDNLTLGLPMEGLSEELEQQVLRVFAAAEEAEMVMLAEVFPLITELPKAWPDELADEHWHESNYHLMPDDRFNQCLADAVIKAAVYRRDREYVTEEDFAQIKRVLRLAVQRNHLPFSDNHEYDRFPKPWPPEKVPPGAVTMRQWLFFLNDLRNSSQRRPKATGAEASRPHSWRESREPPSVRGSGSLPQFTRVVIEAKWPGPDFSESPCGRLHFELLDLRVRPRGGKTNRLLTALSGLVACGDGLDAAWSDHAVLLMHQPGLLEEVLSDPEEQFVAAAWDGQSVWVAGLNKGLVLLDRAGRVIGNIGRQQGLPPHDRKLVIRPIGPGRCLAAGQFGAQGRAWCALIEANGDKPGHDVRVFHEATKIPLRGNTPDDPALVFEPLAFHICDRPSAEGRRIAYLHRQSPSAAAHGNPLAVDLDTLDVSIATENVFAPRHAFEIHSDPSVFTGRNLFAPDFHVPHWERMNGDGPDGKLALCRGAAFFPNLHYYDGWCYITGGHWLRINAQTWQAEFLVRRPLPEQYRLSHYAVSAHYDLVGWSGSGYYRVTVKEVNEAEREK